MKAEKLDRLKYGYPKIWEQFGDWLFGKYRTEECFDYGKIEFDTVIKQFEKFPIAFQIGIFWEFASYNGLHIEFLPSKFPADKHTKGFWAYCYKISTIKNEDHLFMGYTSGTQEQAWEGSVLTIFDILHDGIEKRVNEVIEYNKQMNPKNNKK